LGLASVAAACAVWLALAAAILVLGRRAFHWPLFDSAHPPAVQALAGVAGGLGMAAAQWILIAAWPRWRDYSREALRGFAPTSGQILAIAAMVAFSEEIFFRGAVQPLLGIGITSLLFMLVHMRYDRTAWNRKNLPLDLAAFGMLFAVSAILGALCAYVGLASAMAAHFTYDVAVLARYRRLALRSP
jgi:membrane protease YdiL (CAAX protease family)